MFFLAIRSESPVSLKFDLAPGPVTFNEGSAPKRGVGFCYEEDGQIESVRRIFEKGERRNGLTVKLDTSFFAISLPEISEHETDSAFGPFKFFNWAGISSGDFEDFPKVRGGLVAGELEMLRSHIKGDSSGEHAFFNFISAMQSEDISRAKELDVKLIAKTLKKVGGHFRDLCRSHRAVNLLVFAGGLVGALRASKKMIYTVRESVSAGHTFDFSGVGLSVCFTRNSDERVAIVASNCEPPEGATWNVIPGGCVFTLNHDLGDEILSLDMSD
ncbi:MAG: hypothetical protein NUW37_11750 [Planctomycetes bacterium]|nr:hypothetical protein [Planctomycetota bacterium]